MPRRRRPKPFSTNFRKRQAKKLPGNPCRRNSKSRLRRPPPWPRCGRTCAACAPCPREAAQKHGLAILAAGTHPLARWREVSPSRSERYFKVMDMLRMIGRRNMLCGMHVHVELPDPHARVDVMTRLTPYLPLFVALSASSPFWLGAETGLMAYRPAAYDELPRSGIPELFGTEAEYNTLCLGPDRGGCDRGCQLHLVDDSAIPQISDPRASGARCLHQAWRCARHRLSVPGACPASCQKAAEERGPERCRPRHRRRQQVESHNVTVFWAPSQTGAGRGASPSFWTKSSP